MFLDLITFEAVVMQRLHGIIIVQNDLYPCGVCSYVYADHVKLNALKIKMKTEEKNV